jgi:hypothetical protein
MNSGFVKLTQEIVREKGKDVLANAKLAKALFMDYSHGEYKSEINLLLRTIELGYYDKIKNEPNSEALKLILSRQLVEDHSIIEEKAVQIVSLLASLIKGGEYNNTQIRGGAQKTVVLEQPRITNMKKYGGEGINPSSYNSNAEIKIFLSRKKVFLIWLFPLAYPLGVWIWFVQAIPEYGILLSFAVSFLPFFFIYGIVFIMLCCLFGWNGLITDLRVCCIKIPFLIIGSTGIIVNDPYNAVRHILWQNIETITVKRKNICIILNNPEEYIALQKKSYLRLVLRRRYKIFGSPVAINCLLLKYKYNELESILQEQFKKWKR